MGLKREKDKKLWLERKIIEQNMALVIGHTTGIEWFVNLVRQYDKKGNFVAITIESKETKEKGYWIIGIFIKQTDLMWKILKQYWNVNIKRNILCISLEPINPKTEEDYSNPTKFEIELQMCNVNKNKDIEEIYKYIVNYSDWIDKNTT